MYSLSGLMKVVIPETYLCASSILRLLLRCDMDEGFNLGQRRILAQVQMELSNIQGYAAETVSTVSIHPIQDHSKH